MPGPTEDEIEQTVLMELAPTPEFAQGEVGRIISRPSERDALYDIVYQEWDRKDDSGKWTDEIHLGWVTEDQRKDAALLNNDA